MHKEAFEPTGLIPRSIIRTFDRFRQQLLPGTEQIAIQEYRISRYQILVSIKALCTLIFVPFLVTYTVKFFLITPVTEHFWDYQQGDIFLNSYQEKRAFNEMHDFSEKIFFESLVASNDEDGWDCERSWPPARSQCNQIGCSSSLSKPKANVLSALPHKDVAPQHLAIPPFGAHPKCCSSPPSGSSAAPLRGPARPPLGLLAFSPLRGQPELRSGDTRKFAPEGVEYLDFEPPSGVTGTTFRPSGTKDVALQHLVRSGPVGPAAGAVDFALVPPLGGLKDRPLFTNQDEGRAGLGWPEGPRTTLNLQIRFQKKSLEIAETYNKQSILAITCLLGDFVTLLTLYILFVLPQMKPQVIILKSFLTESLYSLSDTTKSFLLILGMDLLVGFHSPRGWEIVLESTLRHFGLPENESFILLFVALFPVFLDTVFKYWIFRYLNKISPSTVVTYHSMLE